MHMLLLFLPVFLLLYLPFLDYMIFIGNEPMTTLPGFLHHFEENANVIVNRMAIVEVQRMSERHQLSE